MDNAPLTPEQKQPPERLKDRQRASPSPSSPAAKYSILHCMEVVDCAALAKEYRSVALRSLCWTIGLAGTAAIMGTASGILLMPDKHPLGVNWMAPSIIAGWGLFVALALLHWLLPTFRDYDERVVRARYHTTVLLLPLGVCALFVVTSIGFAAHNRLLVESPRGWLFPLVVLGLASLVMWPTEKRVRRWVQSESDTLREIASRYAFTIPESDGPATLAKSTESPQQGPLPWNSTP